MGNVVLDQYQPHVYRFAVYMLRDHHAAQDVAQDTMLRAWRHRDQLHQVREPKAWLLRIAANLCRDQVRRRRSPIRNAESLLDEPIGNATEPWFGLLQQESCEHLEKMIQTLTARERSVLYLSAFEDLSNHDIAEVLELSAGSVKVALSRARKSMRESILRQREEENQP